MRTWKTRTMLVGMFLLLSGCSGGSGGSGSAGTAPAGDGFVAFTLNLAGAVSEDSEPVNVDNVEITLPEDAEPVDVG